MGQLRVLLVEDDDADILIISEALECLPSVREIHVARDGHQAQRLLLGAGSSAPLDPDVILLDLNMPRMNGLELLDWIKSDDRLKVIPTIVLTTSTSQADVLASYDRHANAYVPKPMDFDSFGGTVAAIEAFFVRTALLPAS